MTQRSFLLFSGSNDRAVFALARTFEACVAGYAIIARNRDDHALHSAYRSRIHAIRESDELSLPVLESLLSTVREKLPDDILVIVPSSEYLNTFLLALDREDLRARLGCEVPLVDRELYMALSNKHSSAALFSASGIRVPQQLDCFTPELLPLVAKPLRNVGADNVVRYPLLLRTTAELDAFLARDDVPEYFAQEYINGHSRYLLAYLARDGDAFVSSQDNLAQQAHGKSIVLARTSKFHREPVATRALEMLRQRGFHGFAMIEFIVDARGACFIEVNPRPWGPLQLCADHACGIVEAFVGDALHGNPRRHEDVWTDKPAAARYLWSGGMAQAHRRREPLRWDPAAGSRVLQLAASALSDVYLRHGSWKVFLRELAGQ